MLEKFILHIFIILLLLQVALLGLMRTSRESSIISLHYLNNVVTGTIARVGSRFPAFVVYDIAGKRQPFYRLDKSAFIIVEGCPCDADSINSWAEEAIRRGEDVIVIFPGSPTRLRDIRKDHKLAGRIVTCRYDEILSFVSAADRDRLPIGYHINEKGILISKQYLKPVNTR